MMQPTPNETRTHTDELVDIREVSVDKNLPKEERIAAFIRQIKNPYRFRQSRRLPRNRRSGSGKDF